jgi:4-amino-4-deoxy-L-arabinose transferase-like glycosyltransferase
MDKLEDERIGLAAKAIPWLIVALIILLVIVVRVRLSDVPLERDEDEYAYMGQLILHGVPPYNDVYNMKLPGTYIMYALMMSQFGQSIRGIHFGLIIVNSATILLIFLLGKKIISETAALTASATYAILSLDSSVAGFAAHATHFVVLPALGGVLLLLGALRTKKLHAYWWSGTLFGLAFIMKQPGLFFFLFGFSYIIYAYVSERPAYSFKNFYRLFPYLRSEG